MNKELKNKENFTHEKSRFYKLSKVERDWIYNLLRERYLHELKEPSIVLPQKVRDSILEVIYKKVIRRGLPISYHELKIFYCSEIPSFIREYRQLNRTNSPFTGGEVPHVSLPT
ncbi:hypothetical protein ACH0BF_16420 [Pseudobacillus sp. 179-B 2D1 NHS]|uniref:hypothetical protein n=1 Tax=Pseudobacillus sp. 179-B 2D1 NHS TaxID=3374292 RepID=UPI003879A41C